VVAEMAGRVETLSASLGASSKNAETVSQAVAERLAAAGDSLTARIEALRGASETTAAEMAATSESLRGRAEEMATRHREMAGQLGEAYAALDSRASEAAKAAGQDAERLSHMGEIVRRLAAEAARSTNDMQERAAMVAKGLRAQLDELVGACQRAETGMAAFGEALDVRAGQVENAALRATGSTETWEKKAREGAELLRSVSDDAAKKALVIAEAMERETLQIRSVATEAEKLLTSLKEQNKKGGIEDFLHRASFITEGLQSVAVDLSRTLEAQITEEDWRRYSRGEKGIFVRKMLGFRERSKFSSIRQRYRYDGEFREYVGRYIAQFEGMLEEAKARDHDGVLGATFLSSDMGKLYMLLFQAIDTEE